MRAARLLRPAVVAIVAAVVGSGCGLVGGGGGTYRLVAEFDRTINLFESSQVRVLGLPAGRVADIEVDGARVRVTLDIDDDIPVPADVKATIVPLSLIGERYVQLYPAWTEGHPEAADGDVIPQDRTSVPVEPDEALAALKELLDTLDPDGTGRLITNLSQILDGRGEQLNSALDQISQLTTTFADKDDELAHIIDQFDEFTATLVTREQQLGEIMDAFAEATSVLANERQSIEELVAGLASTSDDLLDLVGEHGPKLQRDLQILGRTLRSVDANLASVGDLLDAGPVLVNGLGGAYDPEFHRTDLRNAYEPTAAQALQALGVPIGDTVCLPIDVDCEELSGTAVPTALPAPTGAAPRSAATVPTPPARRPPALPPTSPPVPVTTPIDDVLALLNAPAPAAAPPAVGTSAPGGVGGFFRSLVSGMLGVAW